MDGFAKYLVRRFFQFFLVIFLGVSLAFLITNLSPVDPVEQSVALMTNFGATDPRSVELMRQALEELYGLQGTMLDQYLAFWGRVLRENSMMLSLCEELGFVSTISDEPALVRVSLPLRS